MKPSVLDVIEHLRDDVPPATDEGRATLARVHRSIERAARARVQRTRLFTLAAAACLTTIAFAHYTGWSPAAIPWNRTSHVPADAARPIQNDQTPFATRVAPFNAAPEHLAPAPTTATVSAPMQPRPTSALAPSAPIASQNGAVTTDPAVLSALYSEAHRLHFTAPPAHALAAWERYLNAHPSGPLATEARYNRAISLLRLGRSAEARTALEPFARGEFGSFRQHDAQRWLTTK